MQFDQGDENSGILAPNSSYRPTQGAIIHSERTEFNDALRARGILPQLPDERSPSPELALKQDPLDTADLEDDDDLLGLEDDIPSHILDKYRESRLAEVSKLQKTRRYGTVLPIGREGYTREITEASKEDVQGTDEDDAEYKGKGTGVVCFLWKDSVSESQLLGKHLVKLAAAYPSTKFVSIRGDMCIANYPDKNIPTMLIYRRGELVRQVIGLGKENSLKGMQTTPTEVEALLIICDAVDPFLKIGPTDPTQARREDDGESEEEQSSKSSRGVRRANVTLDNDDDDLDV